MVSALAVLAEPRQITVSMHVLDTPPPIARAGIMTLALALNELATNAIKHAFGPCVPNAGADRRHVRVELGKTGTGDLMVAVEDDGDPFVPAKRTGRVKGDGFGMDLVTRLVAAHNGFLVTPADGSKRFEIRMRAAA